jgi:hypothetical protein
MAQTEISPATRPSWTTDSPASDQAEDDVAQRATPIDPPPHQEPETPDMIDVTTSSPARRTTKLMADLSRAMQTAAEVARDETVTRFIADSQAAIEGIQANGQVEAADLRRRADDDVAVVREWSKAEIARIREETETRIAARKQALDGEIDAHTAVVETRIQRVGETVQAFQIEMDEFFERLLKEQDPTRIATMAETMPEPPDLAGIAASITEPQSAPFEAPQNSIPDAPSEPAAMAEPAEAGEATTDQAEAETGEAVDAEAAMAARLDFAAAEAEALEFDGDLAGDDVPEQAVEAGGDAEASAPEPKVNAGLANADAGSLSKHGSSAKATTQIAVVGLVSVASIATFKRGLSRSAGVSSVAVASGPNGEFVFSVEHSEDVRMTDVVTALEGFNARITAESTGTLDVTAQDPDTSN